MFQLYILARGRKNNPQYMTKLKNIFLILSNFWKHRVFLLIIFKTTMICSAEKIYNRLSLMA